MERLTDKGIRIELPFMDTTKRKVVHKKECFLHLFDSHLTYKIVTEYETLDDDTSTWITKNGNSRWVRKKSDIAYIGMYFDNVEKLWTVDVEFSGSDCRSDCGWFFQEPKEALKIYNQLTDYLIKGI